MIRNAEEVSGRTAELDLPAGRVTFEEFLERDGDFIEWVDGEIVEMSPVSNDHQRLLRLLVSILDEYVSHNGLGEILFAPSCMKLASRPSAREPDLFFVRTDRLHLLRLNSMDGPADLAVEIVSPESFRRDRVEKLREYAEGGVGEYWILDPEHGNHEFHTLNRHGAYETLPIDADGILHSRAIEGLWLRLEWLNQRPLPTAAAIRGEWKI